ncbi:hypothetical protein Q0F99_12190 [Rathayibacter oskolensis]|uniref:hypothetical protein n=1 Tax=Rathayibacter oskolensis TaxID=1891671 RepID=UPI00265F4C52|nr:hypothetical protein [Rathayibacter oskolensis]WKK70610.1 hypothetical protein Q0F99_12190 [Rathayibacter oskolensis]
MTQASPPPPWGAPTAPTGPRVPLPPRARFEPTALLTSPVTARRLRTAVGAQLRQAAPERQRRLTELAEIGEGVVVLRAREFDRALDRLASPAASATSRGAVVVTLGEGGRRSPPSAPTPSRSRSGATSPPSRSAPSPTGRTASGPPCSRCSSRTRLPPRASAGWRAPRSPRAAAAPCSCRSSSPPRDRSAGTSPTTVPSSSRSTG